MRSDLTWSVAAHERISHKPEDAGGVHNPTPSSITPRIRFPRLLLHHLLQSMLARKPNSALVDGVSEVEVFDVALVHTGLHALSSFDGNTYKDLSIRVRHSSSAISYPRSLAKCRLESIVSVQSSWSSRKSFTTSCSRTLTGAWM